MATGERYSWMLFVDGENFTIRGQRYASDADIKLYDGPHFRKNRYLWIPGHRPLTPFRNLDTLHWWAVRAYYYTSIDGDENSVTSAEEELWGLGFTPRVFKKARQEDKAKGVDICLTKDMLSHAFLDHYEVACLVSGDGDYVPLVEEVKRLGKRVTCLFFPSQGLNPKLKLACDDCCDIEGYFKEMWEKYSPAICDSPKLL